MTTVCHNPTNFIGKCTRVLLLLGTLLHIREEEGEKKIYIKNGAACSGAKGRRNHWRHGDWSSPNFGLYVHPFLKSVNLQYDTLVRWLAGTNDLSTKRLIFQALFFFIISCKILCKNHFILFFILFYFLIYKNFECPESIKNYKKNNTWNIRRLVDESIVP